MPPEGGECGSLDCLRWLHGLPRNHLHRKDPKRSQSARRPGADSAAAGAYPLDCAAQRQRTAQPRGLRQQIVGQAGHRSALKAIFEALQQRLARGLVGLAVTIAAGYAVGFRPAAGIGGWAMAVPVFLLVTLALSLLAALIGLLGKSVEVAQQLAAIIIIPIFFSSALVPAGTMPPWLRVVTANQPVTQAVDTLRALLLNQPPGSHLWLTLTEFGGIIVVAFTLAAILFRRTANA